MRPVISSGLVVGGQLVGDLAAAAHHHDAVADLEDVRHAVADQHDRDALRLHPADEVQHLGHLAHRDGGGRLVHQHELGLGEPGAGDGHRLALAARHLADEVARPGLGLELLEELGRAGDHRLLVEGLERPPALLELAAEEDVLGGGQVVGEREVLVDDLDPHLAGVDRAVEVDDLAFHLDRRRRSGGKLPAMILTSVDLPAPLSPMRPDDLARGDLEVDPSQRLDRAEILGDVLQPEKAHGRVFSLCAAFVRAGRPPLAASQSHIAALRTIWIALQRFMRPLLQGESGRSPARRRTRRGRDSGVNPPIILELC